MGLNTLTRAARTEYISFEVQIVKATALVGNSL